MGEILDIKKKSKDVKPQSCRVKPPIIRKKTGHRAIKFSGTKKKRMVPTNSYLALSLTVKNAGRRYTGTMREKNWLATCASEEKRWHGLNKDALNLPISQPSSGINGYSAEKNHENYPKQKGGGEGSKAGGRKPMVVPIFMTRRTMAKRIGGLGARIPMQSIGKELICWSFEESRVKALKEPDTGGRVRIPAKNVGGVERESG